MPRLIFTAFLIAVTLIALKVYDQKGSVSHHDKIVFNAIVTVLSLALALNFLVGLIAIEPFPVVAYGISRKLSKIWPKSFVGGY